MRITASLLALCLFATQAQTLPPAEFSVVVRAAQDAALPPSEREKLIGKEYAGVVTVRAVRLGGDGSATVETEVTSETAAKPSVRLRFVTTRGDDALNLLKRDQDVRVRARLHGFSGTTAAPVADFIGLDIVGQSAEPGAKAMFYNPAGIETATASRYLPDTSRRIREINYLTPLKHCGIQYWFENDKGRPLSDASASVLDGRFTLHIRASCNGFLTVFDMDGDGRELTPRTDGRWSGYRLGDEIYRVPGSFEFTRQEPAKRLIIVWARAQSEVARDSADAPKRLVEMPKWMPIVREADESTVGEIGTYVVNRTDAGVPAEIRFARR